ncbi:MAG: hypothetical protein ACREOO_23990 [bacterium]
MKTSNIVEIREIIEVHRGFSECILEDIIWKNFGITVEFTIRYIYDNYGRILKSMDDWQILVLRFNLVQELRISNALKQAMCNEPERLNWGFNEIALTRLENDSRLIYPFREFDIPFHHIAILWENERRIDIVFSEMELPQ